MTAVRAALSGDDGVLASDMVRLINRERGRRRLSYVSLRIELCRIAKAHALDMVRRGYMSHVTPEGVELSERLTRAGVRFRACGENIAGSPTRSEGLTCISGCPTVAEAHMGLMQSSGHRENILGDFEEMGIGIARNRDGTLVIVQVFVTPWGH